jgi:hypothetical protein
MYILQLVDWYISSIPRLFLIFVEISVIAYLYGKLYLHICYTIFRINLTSVVPFVYLDIYLSEGIFNTWIYDKKIIFLSL